MTFEKGLYMTPPMSKEVIFGKNCVQEVLRAGKRKIYRIFWSRKQQDPTTKKLKNLILERGIPFQEGTSLEIEKRTGSKEHQGVAAEVSTFEYVALEEVAKKRKFLILLDEIQDPHNVGALIRTAYLLGVSGCVLLKHRSAQITPAVCKASAGATEYLPIVKETNLVNVINYLKKNGFTVLGASGGEGESVYHWEGKAPVALVLGSEGRGLRRLVREHCDLLVQIPMEGEIDSFNVSVAGAILMSEIRRRISQKG